MTALRPCLAAVALLTMGANAPQLVPGRQITRVQASSSVTPEQARAFAEAIADLQRRGALTLSRYPLSFEIVPRTGSMRPTIGDEDLVVFESAPYSELRIGDVVTWRHEFRTRFRDGKEEPLCVLHRIWGGKPGAWRTRGDNNREWDSVLLTPERYLARVVLVIATRKENHE